MASFTSFSKVEKVDPSNRKSRAMKSSILEHQDSNLVVEYL